MRKTVSEWISLTPSKRKIFSPTIKVGPKGVSLFYGNLLIIE